MTDARTFDKIRIGIASPDEIRAWSCGEVRKPEGNSTVTLGNAMSRFAEMESIVLTAGKGRDHTVSRGPQFSELGGVERRLAAYLQQA